mgnify:CR=1 FL=1
MFRVEIRSETMKGLVTIMSTIVDEVKFTIDENGMKFKAVDPAHIAMMSLVIAKGAFESYAAEPCEIGLDLDKIKSVLKLAGPGDIITLEQDESHGKLIIRIKNITRRMSLIDTSGIPDIRLPNPDLSAKVDLAIEHLQYGIKAAESISDHIALRADKEGFELSCDGETDSVNLKVAKADISALIVEEPVCSMFPLDYFSNVVKAIPAGTNVTLEMDNDRPLSFRFGMADGNIDAQYFLAPRIEND